MLGIENLTRAEHERIYMEVKEFFFPQIPMPR